MNHYFHAGGPSGYERGVIAERRKAIKAQYSNLLSTASWLERQMIRFGIWLEFLNSKRQRLEKQRHTPSPYTLWQGWRWQARAKEEPQIRFALSRAFTISG